MQLRLPTLIKESGLDRKVIVSRLGYSNSAKAYRYFDRWLSGEARPFGDQFDRLVDALGVERAVIEAAIANDEEELIEEARRRRALDPTYHLSVRVSPGFWASRRLPADVSEDEAIAIAEAEAKRVNRTDPGPAACLNTPDDRSLTFDNNGLRVVSRGVGLPSMTVGGRQFSVSIK